VLKSSQNTTICGAIMKYLSKSDISFLLNASFVKSPHHFFLFKTLLETGMRIHEVCLLSPKDIMFEETQIYVRGKGNKIRNIDISADYAQLLQLHIKEGQLGINDKLFGLTRQAYWSIIKRYNKIWFPHMFRHTYAINVLRKTGNLRYLQKQLGHARLDTVAKYLQFVEFDKEKAMLGDIYS